MAFEGTLKAKMYYYSTSQTGQQSIWTQRNQVPMFFDESTAALVLTKLDSPPADGRIANTESWEQLLRLLEDAKSRHADSIAFIRAKGDSPAAAIDEVIDHVKEVVTGKHDGNPTSPN